MIQAGFIPLGDRVALAKFLMNTEGLNKAMIGEYLGEGLVTETPLSSYIYSALQGRGKCCNHAHFCGSFRFHWIGLH
jgi:Sec7 domain